MVWLAPELVLLVDCRWQKWGAVTEWTKIPDTPFSVPCVKSTCGKAVKLRQIKEGIQLPPTKLLKYHSKRSKWQKSSLFLLNVLSRTGCFRIPLRLDGKILIPYLGLHLIWWVRLLNWILFNLPKLIFSELERTIFVTAHTKSPDSILTPILRITHV